METIDHRPGGFRSRSPKSRLDLSRNARAIFNRLDAEPGATQRHSKNPPVSSLRKGEKDQTPPTFPPLRRGGRGGESRGASNAPETALAKLADHPRKRLDNPARFTRRGTRLSCPELSTSFADEPATPEQ